MCLTIVLLLARAGDENNKNIVQRAGGIAEVPAGFKKMGERNRIGSGGEGRRGFFENSPAFSEDNHRRRLGVSEIQWQAQECIGDGQGDCEGNEEAAWSGQILTSYCVS